MLLLVDAVHSAAPNGGHRWVGSKAPMSPAFFQIPGLEETLEDDNAEFWASLLKHIASDAPDGGICSALDIGCHFGGLLERIATRWMPERLYGVETLDVARDKARSRLDGLAKQVVIVDSGEWSRIPDHAVDLTTCHEVLYLIEDVRSLMATVASRMCRGGRAYFVLGCHAENPVWPRWKVKLEAMGHRTYDHRPLDILSAGAHEGLVPSIRPLRDPGWVQYDPLRSDFSFPDARTLIDHHFQQKLLFRFVRP